MLLVVGTVVGNDEAIALFCRHRLELYENIELRVVVRVEDE